MYNVSYDVLLLLTEADLTSEIEIDKASQAYLLQADLGRLIQGTWEVTEVLVFIN